AWPWPVTTSGGGGLPRRSKWRKMASDRAERGRAPALEKQRSTVVPDEGRQRRSCPGRVAGWFEVGEQVRDRRWRPRHGSGGAGGGWAGALRGLRGGPRVDHRGRRDHRGRHGPGAVIGLWFADYH